MRNDGMSGGGVADAGNPRAAAARVLFDLLLDGDLQGAERTRALDLLLDILARPERLAKAPSARSAGRHPAVSQALDRLASLNDRLHGQTASGRSIQPSTCTWVSVLDGRMTFDGPQPESLGSASLMAFAEQSPPLKRALTLSLAFDALPVAGIALSGQPVFCEQDGHFMGYRGVASTTRADAEPAVTGTSDDGARLAHELRSPLNAIMGFAELIEREIHGPAPEPMRAGAQRILAIARRLLPALDDLSDSARLELGHYPVEASWIDGHAVIARTAGRYAALAAERQGSLTFASDGALWLQIDESALERLIERLLAATLAIAESGEHFELTAAAAPGDRVTIALNRPARLTGWTSDQLRNPSVDIESTAPTGTAPLVGLGFTMRLVSQLAERLGGSFTIEPAHFRLNLPALETARVASLALAP